MSYHIHRDSEKVVYRSWESGNVDSTTPRVAVLKLDHVGDFWMALAPLRELRRRFAGAHITLVVGSWNIETAKLFRLADDYVAFDFFKRNPNLGNERQQANEIRSLLEGRFDLAIDMRVPDDTRSVLLAIDTRHRAAVSDRHVEPRIDLAVMPGKIKLRRNFAYKLLQKSPIASLIPRRWVDKAAERDQAQMQHMAETLLQLVAKAAARFDAQPMPVGPLPDPIDAPVVVAPFSNSHLRDWPADRYQELVATLSHARRVILIGRPEDSASLDATRRAAHAAGGQGIEIRTDLTERQFTELLGSAALVISNNSGTGHVAAQLGRPTIGIFTASHLPELWGFQGPRVSMLMSAIECWGCGIDVVRRCPQSVRCKFDITAKHVLAEIETLTRHDESAMAMMPP